MYFSALFDQTRLMEDIFRDDLIENNFQKTIKAADNQDKNKVKELNYVEIKTLAEDNHKLSENIEYTISINFIIIEMVKFSLLREKIHIG